MLSWTTRTVLIFLAVITLGGLLIVSTQTDPVLFLRASVAELFAPLMK